LASSIMHLPGFHIDTVIVCFNVRKCTVPKTFCTTKIKQSFACAGVTFWLHTYIHTYILVHIIAFMSPWCTYMSQSHILKAPHFGIFFWVTKQDLGHKTEITVAMTLGFEEYMLFIMKCSCFSLHMYRVRRKNGTLKHKSVLFKCILCTVLSSSTRTPYLNRTIFLE
jgi:hypothetical protein